MAGVRVFVCDKNVYRCRFRAVDDTGGGVGVNLRQRAEKQAADIGEDGGAARGDAVLGQEFIEMLQGMVDALSGLETFEILDQLEVVIGSLLLYLLGAMLAAEAGVRVGNGKTAAAAGGGAIGATGRWNEGINSLWFHFSSFGDVGPLREARSAREGSATPGWFLAKSAEAVENK